MDGYIISKYFSWQIKMLRYFGISVREREGILYKLYAAIIPVLGLSLSMCPTHSIFVNLHHPRVFVENMMFSSGFFAAFSKIFFLFLIKKRIRNALPSLNNELFVTHIKNGGIQEELVSRAIFVASTQGFVIIILAFIYLGSAFVGPIVIWVLYGGSTVAMPFGDISFFNVTYSPNYEIAIFEQCVAAFLVVSNYISSNIFMGAVMAFLSAQCAVLQNVIRDSVQRSHSEMQKDSKKASEWTYLKKELKEIVHYHLAITDTVNTFEDIYSIPALIDFLGMIACSCTSAFYAVAMATLNFRVIEIFALAALGMSLEFITSYWGTELMLEYLNIARACNEVDYVGTDIRFQKGLCMVMQRSQQSVQLTLGKFTPLTLRTFFAVVRGTCSFYMVLNNLDLGSDLME